MDMEKKDNTECEVKLLTSANKLTSFISPITGKPVQIIDADEAVKYADPHDLIETTPEEDRRLMRKVDLYLMPLICIVYAVQFMDKLSISYAAILGMRTDLNMHGDQYSWAGSAFYFGYLAYEFIASYTLQRFNLTYMLSIYIVLWGLILCLHAVPQYAGFIVLRVLLGAFESSVTPAFMIITSQWYRKEEVFLRTGIWYAFNGVGIMVGLGAIGYNIYRNQDSYSIEAWKVIFIVTGCMTIFLGFAVFFHIPSKPTDAWFLTEREKKLIVQRIRVNQQGFGNKHFKKEQFIEALTDYRTWIFFFIGVLVCIPNGGLTNFGSILLNEKLGYSVGDTMLVGMILGAVEFVGLIGFTYVYRYFPNRIFWGLIVYAIVIMATAFLAFGKNHKLQLAGYSMTSLLAISSVLTISLIVSNCAGHTKKVATNAIFLIGYCVGNLIGPQTFLASEAPNYPTAQSLMVACNAVVLVLFGGLAYGYHYDNKKRDRNMDSEAVEKFMAIENHEFADLTDKQNPLFRYTF